MYHFKITFYGNKGDTITDLTQEMYGNLKCVISSWIKLKKGKGVFEVNNAGYNFKSFRVRVTYKKLKKITYKETSRTAVMLSLKSLDVRHGVYGITLKKKKKIQLYHRPHTSSQRKTEAAQRTEPTVQLLFQFRPPAVCIAFLLVHRLRSSWLIGCLVCQSCLLVFVVSSSRNAVYVGYSSLNQSRMTSVKNWRRLEWRRRR